MAKVKRKDDLCWRKGLVATEVFPYNSTRFGLPAHLVPKKFRPLGILKNQLPSRIVTTDAGIYDLQNPWPRALYCRILSASCPIPAGPSTRSSLGAGSNEPRIRGLRVRRGHSRWRSRVLSASECRGYTDRPHWLDQPALAALSPVLRCKEAEQGPALPCRSYRGLLPRDVD